MTKWLERAEETHRFHSKKRKEDKNWKLQHTAKALNRSLGSVCEDIEISKWHKISPNQIERCKYIKDALEFIREEKGNLEVNEFEE